MSNVCSSRVPVSTREYSHRILSISTQYTRRGVKWPSRGRRVIRQRSVHSSVVLNESYCEPDLVMANHHSSYQEERIVSLPKEGKNIFQIVFIESRSKNITCHSQKVSKAGVPALSAPLGGCDTSMSMIVAR